MWHNIADRILELSLTRNKLCILAVVATTAKTLKHYQKFVMSAGLLVVVWTTSNTFAMHEFEIRIPSTLVGKIEVKQETKRKKR